MKAQTAGSSGEQVLPRSTVDVELFALDLSTCTRCRGSLANIEAAIALMKPVLDVTGTAVRVREWLIRTEEQARQHRFLTSPTIRVNGVDIAPAIHESYCESCTDLCGCDAGTRCRVWRYRGEEYEEAPVGLVAEAIMRAASGRSAPEPPPAYDGIPENLKEYLAATTAAESVNTCCSAAVQETCCDPAEKATCCDPDEDEQCSCQ